MVISWDFFQQKKILLQNWRKQIVYFKIEEKHFFTSKLKKKIGKIKNAEKVEKKIVKWENSQQMLKIFLKTPNNPHGESSDITVSFHLPIA